MDQNIYNAFGQTLPLEREILRKEELDWLIGDLILKRFFEITGRPIFTTSSYHFQATIVPTSTTRSLQVKHIDTSAYVSSFIAGVEGIDGGLERVTRGAEEGARSAAVRSREFIMRKK